MYAEDWGCSSEVERLPSMYKALGQTPSTTPLHINIACRETNWKIGDIYYKLHGEGIRNWNSLDPSLLEGQSSVFHRC